MWDSLSGSQQHGQPAARPVNTGSQQHGQLAVRVASSPGSDAFVPTISRSVESLACKVCGDQASWRCRQYTTYSPCTLQMPFSKHITSAQALCSTCASCQGKALDALLYSPARSGKHCHCLRTMVGADNPRTPIPPSASESCQNWKDNSSC